MRDFSPASMVLREYLLGIIKETAQKNGYQLIDTPSVESIENLTSNEGGENESLVFKILKRGQTLANSIELNEELSDCGLRYDLTVPLARYFANNQNILSLPLKTLQIGWVWRADRPQKGRYRQFISCDVDVLGDDSVLAEIDIILTASEIFKKIFENANIPGFKIHLNDRRILIAAATFAGFKDNEYNSVLIALDKKDKIGMSGVKDELLRMSFNADVVDRFIGIFEKSNTCSSVSEFCSSFSNDLLEDSVIASLQKIIDVVGNFLTPPCPPQRGGGSCIIFDPTLVRGMGYYTGPIFECIADDFPSSIAGGGRYDKMIGKISGGTNVPACGFGIGFERIVAMLEDKGFVPNSIYNLKKHAILIEKNITPQQLQNAIEKATQLREEGQIASVLPMNKNIKHQITMLEKEGYNSFIKIHS